MTVLHSTNRRRGRAGGEHQTFWWTRSICGVASLLVTACGSLQSGDAQTIFVPVGDGRVQAELVHSGPVRTAECSSPSTELSSTPLEADDSDRDTDPERERLLCSSAELRYLGRRSAAVFIEDKMTLISRFGIAIFSDFNRGSGFCGLWRRRFARQYPEGDFASCEDFRYPAKILGPRLSKSAIDLITVEFERDFQPNDHGDIREEYPGVLSQPIILTRPVCGYVVYHVFQDAGGKRYNVLEGTDAAKGTYIRV